MQDVTAQVEIPKRALFKAAEVCDLAKVQPYVLRSWEAEFPELGVAKAAGAPRVYRRVDVEQVLKIKHMLLVEGLTLAGARRKLEELTAPVAGDEPVIEALIGENARERLTAIKRGLQSILELLAGTGGAITACSWAIRSRTAGRLMQRQPDATCRASVGAARAGCASAASGPGSRSPPRPASSVPVARCSSGARPPGSRPSGRCAPNP
jgi:DNA-binding transcriptional MerR regulator